MKNVVAKLARRDQGRAGPAAAAGAEGPHRLAQDHAQEPRLRRRADGDLPQAAAPREAQADHHLRRVGLRAQRLPLHAAARVEPAGVLQPRALLRVRVGDRRGHARPSRPIRSSAPSSGRSRARRSTTTAARTSATPSAGSPPPSWSRSTARRRSCCSGDARNNYNDPQAWALRLIRERVKGIIWLNPEGQWGWGIGDSVMPLYAPACDIVRECRTIGQLGEVVDNLVHQWWRRGR